ncbi:MAG: transporter [Myxococcota bacterium]
MTQQQAEGFRSMEARSRGWRSRAVRSALAVQLVTVFSAAPAAAEGPWYAGRLRVATGFDFRSGDFGSDAGDTHVLSVPVSVEYRFDRLRLSPGDRFRLRVTVPYLRVDGPFRGEASGTRGMGVDEGIGDVNFKASYLYFPASRSWPFVELSGRLKIPTASEEKNLGSGEFDYTLETRLAKQFRLGRRRITPFASAGYKFVGEPEDENRDNTWRAGAGVSLRWNDRFSLGARYAWSQSSVPGRGDRHEVGPFAAIAFNDRFSVHPYALAGLSARAADYAVGLQLRVTTRIR